MSNWDGKILTGSNGTKFLCDLNIAAQDQAISRTISSSSVEFTQYQPWMSHSEKRGSWAHLHRTDRSLVPSHNQLRLLKDAFTDEIPLRAIDPTNSDREVNFDYADEIEIFRNRMDLYINQLRELSPDFQMRIDSLVFEIIPLRKILRDRPVRFDGEGMTTQFYRGGIFLTLAKDSDHNHCEDVLNLVHECGHQALNLILCCDNLIEGDPYTPAYSAVRKTFRPGLLAIHAVAAVAYMLESMARFPQLFIGRSSAQWLKTRYSGLITDLEMGMASANGLPLTDLGKKLFVEFESLLSYARGRVSLYEHN